MMSILAVEVYVLDTAETDRSCFLIQSVSVCLFIGELRPLILTFIKEKYLLIPANCFLLRYEFPPSFDLLL